MAGAGVYTVIGWLAPACQPTIAHYRAADAGEAARQERHVQSTGDWEFVAVFSGKRRWAAGVWDVEELRATPARGSHPYTVVGLRADTRETIVAYEDAGSGPEAITLARVRIGPPEARWLIGALAEALEPVLTRESLPVWF